MSRTTVLSVSSLIAIISACAPSMGAIATSGVNLGYSVSPTKINGAGFTSASRFQYLGGNAATGTNFPAFVVYEISGSSVLSSLRTAAGDSSVTAGTINSLTLNLFDEATNGVAGGFNFYYADTSVVLATGASSPAYDITATSGLTTQLGTLLPLGSGTYTPATVMNTALAPYSLTGTDAYTAILNAINSGSDFRIVVAANTTTTKATLSGTPGLAPFITAPTLTVDATAIPEPGSMGLVAGTGLLLIGRRRR